MTGEMARIDQGGRDSNGDEWPTHAAVARALGAELRPFDKYTGPYIRVPQGRVFFGADERGEYACLWPDGVAPAYRAPYVRRCHSDSDREAINAARGCIDSYKRAARRRAAA